MRLSIMRVACSLAGFGVLVACVGGGDSGESGSSGGGGGGGRPPLITTPSPPSTEPGRPPIRDAGPPKPTKDAGLSGTCSGNPQASAIRSTKCQACIELACCSELKACFTKKVAAGKDDCNAYQACTETCEQGSDPQTCVQGCFAKVGDGISDAFEGISLCATDSCAEDCQ
jgi:hypothetical protein